MLIYSLCTKWMGDNNDWLSKYVRRKLPGSQSIWMNDWMLRFCSKLTETWTECIHMKCWWISRQVWWMDCRALPRSILTILEADEWMGIYGCHPEDMLSSRGISIWWMTFNYRVFAIFPKVQRASSSKILEIYPSLVRFSKNSVQCIHQN